MAERHATIRGRRSTIELRTDNGVETTCLLANTFGRRLLGLMGRSGLPAGTEGMLFVPGGSIHTAFMRFPIDAVFIDAEGMVLAITADIQPWRLSSGRGAVFVLELAAGQAEALGLQARARLQPAGDSSTWADLRSHKGWLRLGKRGSRSRHAG